MAWDHTIPTCGGHLLKEDTTAKELYAEIVPLRSGRYSNERAIFPVIRVPAEPFWERLMVDYTTDARSGTFVYMRTADERGCMISAIEYINAVKLYGYEKGAGIECAWEISKHGPVFVLSALNPDTAQSVTKRGWL